jgi:CO/xanthine dehydrogenase Mo-binding subunit
LAYPAGRSFCASLAVMNAIYAATGKPARSQPLKNVKLV